MSKDLDQKERERQLEMRREASRAHPDPKAKSPKEVEASIAELTTAKIGEIFDEMHGITREQRAEMTREAGRAHPKLGSPKTGDIGKISADFFLEAVREAAVEVGGGAHTPLKESAIPVGHRHLSENTPSAVGPSFDLA